MNFIAQICRNLISKLKNAHYSSQSCALKDYLDRSATICRLTYVFLTCSLNLCSNMTRTRAARLPALVARVAAATRGPYDQRARPAWREQQP